MSTKPNVTIKKAYENVIAFLEANKNKKVETILAEVIQMCAAKTNGANFIKNDNGDVTHIYCYYHKRWEDITVAQYSTKNTASGYNSMCKEGTNQWSKQQREAKKTKEELLASVGNGETSPDQLQSKLEAIEEQRQAIVPREDGHGFEVM